MIYEVAQILSQGRVAAEKICRYGFGGQRINVYLQTATRFHNDRLALPLPTFVSW